MLSLHHVSKQPYKGTAALAALRMLSSSTNPSPYFPTSRSSITKSNSETPSTSLTFHPFLDFDQPIFTSQRLALLRNFPKNSNAISNVAAAESVGCPLIVVSFYKFADFPDHAALRKPLKELCERLRVSGGIILAPEGINGSICGTCDSVALVLNFIQADYRLKGLRCLEFPVSPEEEAIHHGHMKSSPLAAGEDAPFGWDHVRVKLKKEIVTLGMPSVSPIKRVGVYVCPREWNNLISDPDTMVIDVRNDYETRIGKFKQAVDPCTTAFREFPSWVDERFKLNKPDDGVGQADTKQTKDEQVEKKMPRVAMYCTGGIRCEKASSFLLSHGFEEVYQLQGGILKYLEDVPKDESLWEGECFVFDKRVSVEHGLVQGTYKLCYGCNKPVSDLDMEAPEWEHGVSCPYCYSSKPEEEKERARARQKAISEIRNVGNQGEK